MAINNTTVVPILWSARLKRFLQANTVYTGRTNRTWQNELQANGDRVRINEGGTGVVVGDYVPGTTTVNYVPVDAGTPIDLVLNKSKYWATSVEDLHAVQSSPDLLEDAVMRAGNELRMVVDQDVRTVMSAGANAGPAMTLDHSVLFETAVNGAQRKARSTAFPFTHWHRLMDNALIPRQGRWVIFGPYTAEVFYKDIELNSDYNTVRQEQLAANGFIGNYFGFDIYVSSDANSSYTETGSPALGSATEEVMVGTDYAVAFVDQVNRVEDVRLTDVFATGVRGLYNYGSVVVENAGLFKSAATISKIPV